MKVINLFNLIFNTSWTLLINLKTKKLLKVELLQELLQTAWSLNMRIPSANLGTRFSNSPKLLKNTATVSRFNGVARSRLTASGFSTKYQDVFFWRNETIQNWTIDLFSMSLSFWCHYALPFHKTPLLWRLNRRTLVHSPCSILIIFVHDLQ